MSATPTNLGRAFARIAAIGARIASAFDAVRGVGRWADASVGAARLAYIIAIAGATYGLGMGAFDLSTPQRWLLPLFAAMKVPLVLLGTFLVCVPGFFVLNSVAGVRSDWARARDAVMAGQAAMAMCLASLTPLTLFLYTSGVDHRRAIWVSLATFTVATIAGQVVMQRRYRVLIAHASVHRMLFLAWIMMYAFVGVQFGWMLRPFVGTPGKPVEFLRDEAFTNAYVAVARIVFGGS